MIEIKNLQMKFKDNVVLNDINLEIGNGIFGLLGQNGAGKTTLMRILATLLTPVRGEIMIDGLIYDKSNFHEIKKQIGYLPQDLGLYPDLTVRESLDYIAGLYGLNKSQRDERITKLLDMTNLTEHQKKKNSKLSGGMKRRVGLIQALLNEPKVLIVDEPTTGLDPEERIKIRNHLSDIGKNCSIIFSTHVIEDLSATCEDMCILNKGNIKFIGKTNELLKYAENHCFECVVQNEIAIKDCTITSKIRTDKGIVIRFVSEDRPNINCEYVKANLEDAYIYMNGIYRKQS